MPLGIGPMPWKQFLFFLLFAAILSSETAIEEAVAALG